MYTLITPIKKKQQSINNKKKNNNDNDNDKLCLNFSSCAVIQTHNAE